jgi:hypothetical protein
MKRFGVIFLIIGLGATSDVYGMDGQTKQRCKSHSIDLSQFYKERQWRVLVLLAAAVMTQYEQKLECARTLTTLAHIQK